MFLYEAVECLFEEMHLNNQNQQRNFMIENFSPTQPVSNNLQSNTLPNLSNYLISQQQLGNTQALPQRNHSNEAIGVRIQSYIHDRRDPLSAIPLTNPNKSLKNSQMNILLLNSPIINDLEAIVIDTSTVPSSNVNNTKTSFVIDLPRIFPSFMTKTSNETNSQNGSRKSFIKHFNRRSSGTNINNSRRSSSGVHHNSRAFKFMNTVITKSASFKRVLFPQSTQDTSSISQQQQQQTDKKQSDSKPSMMIALASASSTSSSSSSTTVVQTTTESSLSSKSANLVQSSSGSVSPNSVNNNNSNNNNNNNSNINKMASQSTSNNNLNASMCTINTPITIISTQLNKTTSQSNLKLN